MSDRGGPKKTDDRTLLDPLSSEELKALREARRKMQEKRRSARPEKGPGAHRIVLGPEPSDEKIGEAPTRAMPALPTFEGSDAPLEQLRGDRAARAAEEAGHTLSERRPKPRADSEPSTQPRAISSSPAEPQPIRDVRPQPILDRADSGARPPAAVSSPEPRPASSSNADPQVPVEPQEPQPGFGANTMMWMEAPKKPSAPPKRRAPIHPEPLDPPKRSSWLARGVIVVLFLLLVAVGVGFVMLNQPRGALVLHSTPAGAQVHIDGRAFEEATPVKVDLPAGEHEIALTLAGHQEQRMKVEVAADQEATREVWLLPLSRAGLMTVTVTVQPVAASIRVNDKMFAQTHRVDLKDLDPKAAHELEAKASGYKSQTLQIKPGALKARYDLSLEKAPETPAEPAGAPAKPE